MKTALLIPTYNGGVVWKKSLEKIREQDIVPERKVIIDSGSRDDTVKDAELFGFDVEVIKAEEFKHGKVRQTLISLCGRADICIFLTQDAILANPASLRNLLDAFRDESVGMAYGRQLPHDNAKPLEAHARLYNYPDKSEIRASENIEEYGFKTIFCSNSFAAYRRSALESVGGFPVDTIMGEDTLVAARMIKANWKVAYVAEATVFHSHSYTLMQELRRYFDTGVFHAQNTWLYTTFGKPTGNGVKYVKSEIKYALGRNILSAFNVLPKTLFKLIGFTLGKKYALLPPNLVRFLSMHKTFWN